MSNIQFTDEVIDDRINAKQLGFPADEAYREVCRKYAKKRAVDAEYAEYAEYAEENKDDKLGREM